METPQRIPHDKQPTYRRRRIAAGVGAAGVLAVLVFTTFRSKDEKAGEPGAGEDRKSEPGSIANSKLATKPVRSSSRFLNAQPGVKYVGSERCRDCHEDERRSYAASLHSRSLSRVDLETQPPNTTFVHKASHRSYRVERSDDRLWHREFLNDSEEQIELAAWPVSYQVGSGHVAKSYLIEDDGFLLESPVSWYAKTGRWEMSPGYDKPGHSSFLRVISSGCLYCHAGHVDKPRQHGFRHRIVETAIGCERCHGPGELHVRLRTSGEDVPADIDRTIVNPKHLSRELGEAVCAQCHLQGDVTVSPRGSGADDYRPGLPLREYRLEFRKVDPSAKMRVAGHVEQLRRSSCYQNSTTLTCMTCHQPHDVVKPAERIAHSRAICAGCHQEQRCKVSLPKRQQANDNDCVRCHMPRTGTEVTHVALTNHRIGIHPAAERRSANSKRETGTPSLEPIQDLVQLSPLERNRVLGLAYLKLVRKTPGKPQDSPHFAKAKALLRKCYDDGLKDPDVLAALAGIARVTGRLQMAEELGRQALQAKDVSPKTRIEALDILAEVCFRARRYEDSAAYLRRATQCYRNPLHWYVLGTVEERLGRRERAIAAFERLLRISPDNADAHRELAALLDAAGKSREAARHRELAKRLRAVNPSREENR